MGPKPPLRNESNVADNILSLGAFVVVCVCGSLDP